MISTCFQISEGEQVEIINYPVFKPVTVTGLSQGLGWDKKKPVHFSEELKTVFSLGMKNLDSLESKTLHAFDHPLLAVLLNPYLVDDKYPTPKMLKGIAKVNCKLSNGLLYCDEIRIQREMAYPVILPFTKIRIAFGCLFKIIEDRLILDYALSWFSGTTKGHVADSIQNYCRGKARDIAVSTGQCSESQSYLIACDLMQAIKATEGKSESWANQWVAKVIAESHFIAEKRKKGFKIIDVVEKSLSQKICFDLY